MQYQKLFNLYSKALEIHILTKGSDHVFHKFTESVYDELFDVFHTISERSVDNSEKQMSDDEIEMKKIEVYDAIEEVKKELETMVNKKNTVGLDNLLRGHIDSLENLCGNARAFLPKL